MKISRILQFLILLILITFYSYSNNCLQLQGYTENKSVSFPLYSVDDWRRPGLSAKLYEKSHKAKYPLPYEVKKENDLLEEEYQHEYYEKNITLSFNDDYTAGTYTLTLYSYVKYWLYDIDDWETDYGFEKPLELENGAFHCNSEMEDNNQLFKIDLDDSIYFNSFNIHINDHNMSTPLYFSELNSKDFRKQHNLEDGVYETSDKKTFQVINSKIIKLNKRDRNSNLYFSNIKWKEVFTNFEGPLGIQAFDFSMPDTDSEEELHLRLTSKVLKYIPNVKSVHKKHKKHDE